MPSLSRNPDGHAFLDLLAYCVQANKNYSIANSSTNPLNEVAPEGSAPINAYQNYA